MKKIFFILALGTLSACTDSNKSTTEATETIPVEQVADAKQYACPMHCEGEKPDAEAGKCPVCEMDLKEVTMTEAEPTGHEGHNH